MLKWLFGREDRDDTQRFLGSADEVPTDATPGEPMPAPGIRQPVDLRRAKREQRRAVGGWWRDEYGNWHEVP